MHEQVELYVKHVSYGTVLTTPLDKFDPCVFDIFEALRLHRIRPLFTEYAVYDEALGVATSIDLLGIDEAHDVLCVIELTTGYGSLPFIQPPDSTRRLAAPLDALTDTPAQRKFLQAWFAAEMLRRHYGVKQPTCCLIRCNPLRGQLEVVTSMQWTSAFSRAKLEAIYASIAKRTKRK